MTYTVHVYFSSSQFKFQHINSKHILSNVTMIFRRPSPSQSAQSDATSGPSSLLPSDSLSQAPHSRPTPSEAETPSSPHHPRVAKRRKVRATSTWDHFREAEGDEPYKKDGKIIHYCKRCNNPRWSTHVSKQRPLSPRDRTSHSC